MASVLPPSFGQASSAPESLPELPLRPTHSAGSAVLLDVPVHRITPLKALLGRLVLTASTLLFLPCPESVGADEHGWLSSESADRDFYWMWFLTELTSVRLKRWVHVVRYKIHRELRQTISEIEDRVK